MAAPDLEHQDDELAGLMAACDEMLATGLPASVLSSIQVPNELQQRLNDDLALVKRLRRLRPSSSFNTPQELSGATLPTLQSGHAALPSLGRFRIIRELGAGGFGCVFLAHDPSIDRDVALKVSRAGIPAAMAERQRFRHEALAAGRLDHPNIVPIYEAGEVGPICYIAAAFCPGITLAARLQQRPEPVSWREAAQMTIVLAQAVQHAHSRGVLHRDLKPANILISEFPNDAGIADSDSQSIQNLKITDFGLAKITDEDTGQTRSGVVLGTASYMAPEQAEGKSREVGTAADVYSLGAILYEMLTGRPPFVGESQLATLQQVRETEPVAPRRLNPRVPRDLETICLKCLQKQPQRRYASAGALAEDLQRFLAGEPILARPVSTSERAWKWSRRRPTTAALVIVTIVSVLALLAGFIWHDRQLYVSLKATEAQREEARRESERAERNFEKACDAVDKLLAEVGQNRLAHLPHLELARRQLLKDALAFYQGFLAERGSDERVRHETAQAYRRMGSIYLMLGQFEGGEAMLRQAIPLFDQLIAEFPAAPEHRRQLSLTHFNLGQILWLSSRHEAAETEYLRARQLQDELANQYPLDPRYRSELSKTYTSLARVWESRSRFTDAEKAHEDAIRLAEQVVATHPEEPSFRQALAQLHFNLAVLFDRTARKREAVAACRIAQELQEKLLHDQPDVPSNWLFLADTLELLGTLMWQDNRAADAEPIHRRALDLYKKLVEDYPHVQEYRRALAICAGSLAHSLGVANRHDEGDELLRFSATLGEKLLSESPDVAPYQINQAVTLWALGKRRIQQSDLNSARPDLERVVTLFQAVLAANQKESISRASLPGAYHSLIETLIALGDYMEAARRTEEFVGRSESWRDFYSAAGYLAKCVRLIGMDTRLTEADRTRLAVDYGSRSVQLLREASKRDFSDAEILKKEETWNVIRARDDFMQLMQDLKAAAKQAKP
jgi:tetratricopeptide (TPR) repeat protein